jgi:glycine/D-amino acid oxidase-like deaminating enzyme
MVYGIVGYMAGYVEPRKKDPIAISYFPHHKDIGNGDPYFYLTRRNFKSENNENLSLICIGGPEKIHETEFNYYRNRKYPKRAKEQVDKFLKQSYKHTPEDLNEYHFAWHGLMGYTQNSIRCIGPEPSNPVLLYNLGCNGIGILPSIYGGKKISDHIAHKPVPKTIFDPVRK